MKNQICAVMFGLAVVMLGMPSDGLFAQTFKRQVLGSVGFNHVQVGTVCIASTIGQPPNAGTIGAPPNFILRQGFQQPSKTYCGLQVSFDVTAQILPNNCGKTYIFEYTGSTVPGLEVSWSFGTSGIPASYQGLISPNVSFPQAGVQTIMMTISTGSCTANFSQNVQVEEGPFQIAASVLDAKCFGDKGAIQLQAIGLNTPFSFLWENGTTDPNRNALPPGKYAYSVSDSKGCFLAGLAEVKGATEPLRLQPKTYSATCDTSADGRISLAIYGGVSPYQVLWNDDVDSTNRQNIQAGAYAVTVTDELGCAVSVGIQVGELCKDPNLPDTFTPNGDGVNDAWEIPDLDQFPNHEVRIYNRWGNVVFAADGNYVPWPGVNTNGKELPEAAYFYRIKLNDPTNIIWDGAITIIR